MACPTGHVWQTSACPRHENPVFYPARPWLRYLTPQPCKIIWPKTDDWFWSHLETKAPCRDGQHPSEWAKNFRSGAIDIFWQSGLSFMVMRQSSFAMATKPESRRHSICNRKLGNRNHKHDFPKCLTYNRLQTRLFFTNFKATVLFFLNTQNSEGCLSRKNKYSDDFCSHWTTTILKDLGKVMDNQKM